MALFSNASGYLTSPTLPTGDISWCCWMQWNTTPSGFKSVMAVDNGSAFYDIESNSAGSSSTIEMVPPSGSSVNVVNPGTSAWSYLAGTARAANGATNTAWGANRATLPSKVTSNNGAARAGTLTIAAEADGGQVGPIIIGNFIVYDGLLNDDQLKAQAAQLAPMFQGVWFWSDFATLLGVGKDKSGRGNHFTNHGTWVQSSLTPNVPDYVTSEKVYLIGDATASAALAASLDMTFGASLGATGSGAAALSAAATVGSTFGATGSDAPAMTTAATSGSTMGATGTAAPAVTSSATAGASFAPTGTAAPATTATIVFDSTFGPTGTGAPIVIGAVALDGVFGALGSASPALTSAVVFDSSMAALGSGAGALAAGGTWGAALAPTGTGVAACSAAAVFGTTLACTGSATLAISVAATFGSSCSATGSGSLGLVAGGVFDCQIGSSLRCVMGGSFDATATATGSASPATSIAAVTDQTFGATGSAALAGQAGISCDVAAAATGTVALSATPAIVFGFTITPGQAAFPPFAATITDIGRGFVSVTDLPRCDATIDDGRRFFATITDTIPGDDHMVRHEYYIGDAPQLPMTFKDTNGPKDPTGITVYVQKAGGTETLYISPTRDAEGVFHQDLPQLTSADVGRWYYRVVATGAVEAGTPDGSFVVKPSRLAP